jgi:hypothetical protein
MSFDVFLVTFRNGVNAAADAPTALAVLGRVRHDPAGIRGIRPHVL